MTIPFLTVKPKSIKCKVSPRFPAQLIGGAGTSVTKANGNYTIDLNYAEFAPIASLPSPPLYTLIWNGTQYSLAPINLLYTAGLPEAPNDGSSYGRNSLAWAKVLPIAGGTLTGALILNADPVVALGAATKQMVDLKAPLASPALTGTPTVPTATIGTNTTQAASTAFVLANTVNSIAGNVGAFTLSTGLANTVNALRVALSTATASMGADLAISNSVYTDGPSMAQGTAGTWWASGNVTATDTANTTISCKLWDGTTVVDSTAFFIAAGGTGTAHLSGSLASPAANLRISCKSATATSTFKFNASGNSKDCTINGVRIA